MDSAALDEIAAELYALPPAQFTAARNARAAASGDASLAAAVRSLRKPSVAAFAVNTFVRESADDLARVFDLAEALREAQDDLDSSTLAELAEERRDLVAALARDAAYLAGEAGVPISPAARDDVARTLNAAMMDAAAGDAVRTGRLVRTLQAIGFGEVDLDGAVAGTVITRPAPAPRDDLAERRARKAAERAARQAHQEASEADRALARAEAMLTHARDRAQHTEERVAEVRADLARLEAAAREAGSALERAEHARDVAAAAARQAREHADTVAQQIDPA